MALTVSPATPTFSLSYLLLFRQQKGETTQYWTSGYKVVPGQYLYMNVGDPKEQFRFCRLKKDLIISLNAISLCDSFSSTFYATAVLLCRSQEAEMWQEKGYLEMSQSAIEAATLWLEWLQDFHKSNIMYIFLRFILNSRKCIHIIIGLRESGCAETRLSRCRCLKTQASQSIQVLQTVSVTPFG